MIETAKERAEFHGDCHRAEWIRLSVWTTDFCRKRVILQDREDSTWARSVLHPEWTNEARN